LKLVPNDRDFYYLQTSPEEKPANILEEICIMIFLNYDHENLVILQKDIFAMIGDLKAYFTKGNRDTIIIIITIIVIIITITSF